VMTLSLQICASRRVISNHCFQWQFSLASNSRQTSLIFYVYDDEQRAHGMGPHHVLGQAGRIRRAAFNKGAQIHVEGARGDKRRHAATPRRGHFKITEATEGHLNQTRSREYESTVPRGEEAPSPQGDKSFLETRPRPARGTNFLRRSALSRVGASGPTG